MSKLTRNWLIGMVAAWSLLAAGVVTGSVWMTGAATFVFLVFVVERYHNWTLSRRKV
jgi:hypothetical protein